MYRELSFVVYCALLVFIALSSATLQSDFGVDANPLPQHNNSSQFEDATINAYDNKTVLLYRLSSPIIRHQQDSGFEFEQPRFIYRDSASKPLNITSEKGYMKNNSALIKLSGDVNLSLFNTKEQLNEHLYTKNATIDLDSKKAYTDDKATFEQHKKITEGIGMVADLEAQTVKLKSNIKILSIP